VVPDGQSGRHVTAAAYLGDQAIEAMFAWQAAIVAVCSARGSPANRGGYQAAGKFAFGSGCAHAAGSVRHVRDDENRPRCSQWNSRSPGLLVPRNNVEFLGNWNPPGLVGTAVMTMQWPTIVSQTSLRAHHD